MNLDRSHLSVSSSISWGSSNEDWQLHFQYAIFMAGNCSWELTGNVAVAKVCRLQFLSTWASPWTAWLPPSMITGFQKWESMKKPSLWPSTIHIVSILPYSIGKVSQSNPPRIKGKGHRLNFLMQEWQVILIYKSQGPSQSKQLDDRTADCMRRPGLQGGQWGMNKQPNSRLHGATRAAEGG